jgi:phosphonate metabolism protein PhnN/1,5-bisphosphokinase (PRPP-forming)
MSKTSGILVLVVGPSGAGKDSVMRGAAALLGSDGRHVFPRRVVTRPADSDAEDHDSMTEAEFAAALGHGGFLLSWQAHGNHYGIPVQIACDLAAGKIVCLNVSRTILQEAARRFPYLVIAEVTADAELRVKRIQRRGREQGGAAATRALGEAPAFPSGIKTIRIENNGRLEDAVAQFAVALRQL